MRPVVVGLVAVALTGCMHLAAADQKQADDTRKLERQDTSPTNTTAQPPYRPPYP